MYIFKAQKILAKIGIKIKSGNDMLVLFENFKKGCLHEFLI